MIATHYSDFEKYGCPNCGCDSAIQGSFICYGETIATCQHCKFQFYLMPDNKTIPNSQIGTGRKDSTGKDILEPPILCEHPRKSINKWHYERPDIRPENGGEYWKPRGIGYDLSGFVKSKQAGERLLEIVKEILGKDNPDTYLDYRESEPNWIQFKFQKSEFNLEKLYNMTENTGIITKEIIKGCKL